MICITKIEALEVPEDWYEIYHYPDEGVWLRPVLDGAKPEPIKIEVVKEIVRGTHIQTADGKDICIGMSKQAGELLGLPFEVIENQAKTINAYTIEIESLKENTNLGFIVAKRLEQRLNVFLKMSFRQRLTFLFRRKGENK